MVGKEILGYHVDEKIGSGGFGTVYKVSKSNVAGTYVRALKHITLPTKKQYASVLNSMGGDYTKADDYFTGVLNDIVGEIRILSMLSESGIQNIVRYFENDIVETQSPKSYDIYILMEYLTPFPDFFEEKEFTVRDVISLGKDILAALISCHGKNIIHRDIKDDNIFVSPEGVYKLGDFGVSKALNDKSRAESVKGTPNFIAPEVYLGKETYDNTVDLYSLGIVLYKLLNKSRNPFMPMFPQPYSTADEDTAFEQRMRGEIPELPLDAQNELGKVVLKAIMPRAERYNNAQEFLGALQKAEQILSAEELNMKVNVIVTRAQDISKEQSVAMEGKASLKTIGDDMYLTEDEESTPAEDRHLFDTMGTFYPEPNNVSSETFDPKKEVVRETEETEQTYGKGEKSNFSYNVDEKSIVPPQVAAVDKKDFRWLIYLTPVLIAAIYIVVFLIVIPKTYGKAISVIEWMFSGPENIIETLTVPDNVLNPIYKIIGFKVINWILSGAFVVSLFAVGYMLQNTKPKVSLDAKLTGKSAYLTVMDLYEQVKLITGQDTSGAKKALYSLCERLKNESDFGTGSVAVINCENEIAAFLSAIQGNISGLNNPSTAPETNKNIEILCQRIQAKLKMRIELKKR